MKKSAFMEGAVIATICIVISKILGIIYVIPFYSLIGEQGGALYGYAYNIYGLFLNLSTVGVPFAISKITSEYDTLKQYNNKLKAYKISKYLMCILGLICFIILIAFAPLISDIFIGNIEGGNTKEDVTYVIRVVSTALLIVPLLSVLRGYLQGHKYISVSSISQVIEQLVRVLVIVIGSYICLKVFKTSLTKTIGIAVFSATISALIAYIYLKIKVRKHEFNEINQEEKLDSTKVIIKKILYISVPFILLDVIGSLYSTVDLSTINKVMVNMGYSINESESVVSIITTWGSKLNMIVIAISSGMIVSLVPNIASLCAIKDYKNLKDKINESLSSLLYVVLPMVIGLSLISKDVWVVFFGSSSTLGPIVFKYFVFTSLFMSIYNVVCSTMHSLGYSKTMIFTLLLGLIVKIVLNTPLMYLFNKLGIHPSYGVITSTIISNFIVSISNLIYIKKKINISYKNTLNKLVKTIIPLSSMIIVVLILRLIISTSSSRVISLLYSIVYGVVGCLVYLFVSIKTKLIYEIFGDDIFNKLIKKIKKFTKTP